MKKIFPLILILFFNSSNAQIVDNLIVFPNPFTTTATIEFQLFQSDTVSLNVFDLLGSNVLTYFNHTYLPSGNYSITLDGSTLPQGVYFVQLKIADSTYNQHIIKQGGTTSTENIETKNTITIYPNPATDKLTIEIPSARLPNGQGISPHQIEITDALGRKIFQSKNNLKSEIINLKSSFPSGIYFIKVQLEDGGVTVRKFVKE